MLATNVDLEMLIESLHVRVNNEHAYHLYRPQYYILPPFRRQQAYQTAGALVGEVMMSLRVPVSLRTSCPSIHL